MSFDSFAMNASAFPVDLSSSAVAYSDEPLHSNRDNQLMRQGSAAPLSYATHVNPNSQQPQAMLPTQRTLVIRVLQGKSFADSLLPSTANTTLSLSVSFLSRRYQTQQVDSSQQPNFQSVFTCPLPDADRVYTRLDSNITPQDASALNLNAYHKAVGLKSDHLGSVESLLSVREPLVVCLYQHTQSDTSPSVKTLIGTSQVEWRSVLLYGKVDVDADVHHTSMPELTVGIVCLSLSLLPLYQHDVVTADVPVPLYCQQQVLATHLRIEKTVTDAYNQYLQKSCLKYIKELESVSTSTSLVSRTSLFVHDECQRRKFICSYVQPLIADGLILESPLQAARFVHLIPLKPNQSLERGFLWITLPTMLAQQGGDVAEHAILLCSLLLGFGLDAYVAVGTAAPLLAHQDSNNSVKPTITNTSAGHYLWVVTVDENNAYEPTHWDPVSGERYRNDGPMPFQELHAVFRHDQYHTSIQTNPRRAKFNFKSVKEGGEWVSFNDCSSSRKLPRPTPYKLYGNSLSSQSECIAVEGQLKTLITLLRSKKQLSTQFSSQLCYLLQPALLSYEMEQTYGVSVGGEMFTQSIYSTLQKNNEFISIPFHTNHLNTFAIMQKLTDNPLVVQLLNIQDIAAKFAIKIRIEKYPENIISVYGVLAAEYLGKL